MRRGARRLGAALASLVAVAALVGATATAAGPAAEKLKLGVALGSPEGVIAYGKSQLLLLGGYGEEKITLIGRDGTIDRSFGDGGHVDIDFAGVTVAPDGKILVASCEHAPGDPESSDGQVTRLLPNGNPDPSFGADGSVLIDFGGRYDCAESTAVAVDGDILVGGNRTNYSDRGTDATPAFARLHTDGSLDRSFGKGGVRIVPNGYESGVYDIAVTPDGGILGIGEDIGARLWKLTATGSLDRSFGSGGTVEVPGYGKHRVGGGHYEADSDIGAIAFGPNSRRPSRLGHRRGRTHGHHPRRPRRDHRFAGQGQGDLARHQPPAPRALVVDRVEGTPRCARITT